MTKGLTSMKKLSALLLAGILSLSLTAQAFAAEPQQPDIAADVPLIVETAYTDKNGAEIPVETQYEIIPLPSARSGEQEYELQATAEAKIKNPNARYENTETGEVDGDIFTILRGTLTIRYSTNGFRQYKITSVNGSWTPNSSSLPLKNKYVEASGRKSIMKKVPSGNSFNYTTGFSDYTLSIDSKPYAYSRVNGGGGTAPGNWGELKITVYPD